jgi:hypothetical protein
VTGTFQNTGFSLRDRVEENISFKTSVTVREEKRGLAAMSRMASYDFRFGRMIL